MLGSAHFLILYTIQAQEIILPTVGSPYLINLIKIIPHRHGQRPVYHMVLDVIKLTVDINRLFWFAVCCCDKHCDPKHLRETEGLLVTSFIKEGQSRSSEQEPGDRS